MLSREEIINLRKSLCKRVRRLVIKVGSSVITTQSGLNVKVIEQLVTQIAKLHNQGKEVILVSSGAIAAGMRKMGLKQRPVSLPQQQALAAIGQSDLIRIYEEAFAIYNLKVAQVLLTRDGLVDRHRYLNARHTFFSLLHWGIVPIVNENDTVAVEEIKFGDNDFLAGFITAMLEADLLILLTDMNGLYNHDPRFYPEAKRLPIIEKIDKKIEALGKTTPSFLGRGGIASKIKVAKDITAVGIPVFIAKGDKPGILNAILEGEDVGTLFLPQKTQRLRKHWLASLPAKGELVIDEGAIKAIKQNGKSLLPSGIKKVKGQFFAGDPVYCVGEKGERIAIGLVNYNSTEVEKIKGLNTKDIIKVLGYKGYDEVIHRDNLCVLED
ncbi:MAG TPA: glutamate 5-kinase [Candidatus Desulfofervidus auxilii]|uniref:Glutamate 5-kinase n=1 Tax=Desulfofervidus auxilii TaxID=1621989 RepID=A0A7C0Y627_DESA2|nr:glutamate 5-kinase [Candidatus Desulfofervidus auxilii]